MSGGLSNKRVLLGVSGGIAAYKSAEVCRRLQDAGADVRIVMTPAAGAFITPLTLQALSGHPVHDKLLDAEAESGMGHIELARWADLILVAPATADFLARLVQGISDDLLTACCRAAEVPVAVAPAMNKGMWFDAATQRNVDQLVTDGVRVFGPASGSQACGEVGEGRMLEPAEIAECSAICFQTGALQSLRVLITAGPTYEDIDPVRFLGNRSSGRMGYAVAGAAMEAGALVELVSGPVALADPDRVAVTRVRSADEMLAAVKSRVDRADIFIAVAAVADYKPVEPRQTKMKKTDDPITLELEPNPDILGFVTSLPAPPFAVGFAAETEAVAEYAKNKLTAKRLDMVAANQVGAELGFGDRDSALRLFWQGGDIELTAGPKPSLARALVAQIAARYDAKHSTEDNRSAAGH